MTSTMPMSASRSVAPSCCATQPATATSGSRPVSSSEHAQLAEPRVELLLGVLAHAARVDDDDVGVAVVVRAARSPPLRAAPPSARSRGRSSGSRRSRSGTSAHVRPFARRLSLSPFAFASPFALRRSASSSRGARAHAAASRHRSGIMRASSVYAGGRRRAASTRGDRPAAADLLADAGSASSPRAAICGRCVMQSTWYAPPELLELRARRRRRRARRCRRRPRRRSASCPGPSRRRPAS